MDPDSVSWIIGSIASVLSLLIAYLLGCATANDIDDELNSRLGFSDRVAGLYAAFVLVCGFIIFAGLRVLPNAWWLVAVWAGFCLLWAVLLAFGRCSKLASRDTFSLAAVLGSILTLPAKGIFHAAHLSAQENVTEEDVLSMVDDVEEQDMIDESQKEMITNIFELDDVAAGEIMTHRTEIDCVAADVPASEVIKMSLQNGYSRMPVYENSVDNIIGILFVKDLFTVVEKPALASAPAKSFMRPVMFVPESCRARDLLVEFKKKHTQIAVVVDEYGGTGGLVTMEDVLEEIVGNIQDEFDNEEEELVHEGNGSVTVAGSVDLEDVFGAFDMEMPQGSEDEDFDSVSGMMIDRLGRIPAENDTVSVAYGGLLFTVVEVGERRIDKVNVTAAPMPNAVENEEKN